MFSSAPDPMLVAAQMAVGGPTMRRIRIERPARRESAREWIERVNPILPVDPRDPDVSRVKAARRRGA
jgi:hypothetical protein